MLNAAGDSLRGRLNDAIARRDLPMVVTGLGSMMAVHAGVSAPRSAPEASARNRRLIDLLHLDLIASGIYTARRGMMVLSLPMGAAEFDRFAAAFEEFLEIRRSVIMTAGEEAP